eukprot:TRINITY_DN1809_c0_g1_i1.p1 TRINITY_DN1809_c0_g1~~TRINITY_DN1809_c0_g1_i1.p1  ORF type:complete len:359 (+),score=70.60 TRINITY_DN1809_c0_g1_i1:202-1278(+)
MGTSSFKDYVQGHLGALLGPQHVELAWRVVVSYSCVVAWMISSGAVVLHNKWLMTVFNFSFPATMTAMHMSFSFVMAFLACKVFRLIELPRIDRDQFLRSIAPIGTFYSVVLVCSNYSYIYLSVAFIQMIKAGLPVLVYFASIVFGVAKFNRRLMWCIVTISVGIFLVANGELNMSIKGFVLQVTALCFESCRLVMIEVLMKRKGINLNPLTTLFYVAPVTLVCILIPVFAFESNSWPIMSEMLVTRPLVFLGNCTLAFILNLAVFLIIGRTSALTMNIAGIAKDVLVIGISTAMFHSALYAKSLLGFGIAITGVGFYNYIKFRMMQEQQGDASRVPPQESPIAVSIEGKDSDGDATR